MNLNESMDVKQKKNTSLEQHIERQNTCFVTILPPKTRASWLTNAFYSK